ncbi:MAG: hypothetical protein FWD66_08415 [Paludibacter sp.]|nr:hypothetical protein [Paludibacter sp.]
MTNKKKLYNCENLQSALSSLSLNFIVAEEINEETDSFAIDTIIAKPVLSSKYKNSNFQTFIFHKNVNTILQS